MELDSARGNGWQTGFVSSTQVSVRTYNQFCDDLTRLMSINYLKLDDYGVLTTSSSPADSNQSCSEQIALREQRLQEAFVRQGGLTSLVPRLERPEIMPARFTPLCLFAGQL